MSNLLLPIYLNLFIERVRAGTCTDLTIGVEAPEFDRLASEVVRKEADAKVLQWKRSVDNDGLFQIELATPYGFIVFKHR